MQKNSITIFWFRRDLRMEDNAALYYALKSGLKVLPIFIFDKNILDRLKNKKDARVVFIHNELARLKKELENYGSTLQTYYGTPEEAWQEILGIHQVGQVYANRDYELYARDRDQRIYDLLQQKGIRFHGSKDHVIFEKGEVTKDDGLPYTVFTPYSKKWKAKLNSYYLKPYPTLQYAKHFLKCTSAAMLKLSDIGFEPLPAYSYPDRKTDVETIRNYEATRDYPAKNGTTRLSLHLRFGTISIRALCTLALQTNEKWLNELIWRDFYQMILFHFPHSEKNSFKPSYDRIEWINDEKQFAKWCEGKTGYPLVDAGMRELNQTGFMHNRVRMVTASFLTKHLLIDWRWGAAYFAEKLLDFDMASNIGGWQWAAGCGCDAAPYFRVFNPEIQMKKFDPEKKYIRHWIPEFDSPSYPSPIVEHKLARERCLSVFKKGLES